MERAEVRRLQPHFVAAFFIEAFQRLGGAVREREPKRYEVTHVPAVIRNRDRVLGRHAPVLTRYERIAFEKHLISTPGTPLAEFVCPGHPLLDATLDLILERYRALLKHGAVLIDEDNRHEAIRALVYLEHALQDARTDRTGNRRIVSRQVQFAEITEDGHVSSAGFAPYLDYRPPTQAEHTLIQAIQQPRWLREEIESRTLQYAVQHLVPHHLQEVKARKEQLVDKTLAAVKERLTVEISHWDHRAAQLKQQELAGKVNAKINSGKARQRADDLAARLQQRMDDLQQERQLSALPPHIIGGAMIIPRGLLQQRSGTSPHTLHATETRRVELTAMHAVMAAERALGFLPRDVSASKCGYDIESSDPTGAARLRFIEVKGRVRGAATVTLTKNEILSALNKPEQYILAIVEVEGETARAPVYIRKPFVREPDFGVTASTTRWPNCSPEERPHADRCSPQGAADDLLPGNPV